MVTRYEIKNKKDQELLNAHEYVIQRYIENLKRSRMPQEKPEKQ